MPDLKLNAHFEKKKAPHQGEECEAFKTARLEEGEGLAVRLMSGQRIGARWRCGPTNSSNGLQQGVSGRALGKSNPSSY
jgi:hypothetical protein